MDVPTGSFTIERSSTLIQNIFLVENNALNATNEKQRQDAEWLLPYLEGEKKTTCPNNIPPRANRVASPSPCQVR
ncbi:hypothetical protein, partial [Yersinia aldovae]|uniref:hypothetical protein n=1 Tax=Yersinia aldovae TaxID=29483 RepID=UPI001AD83431